MAALVASGVASVIWTVNGNPDVTRAPCVIVKPFDRCFSIQSSTIDVPNAAEYSQKLG